MNYKESYELEQEAEAWLREAKSAESKNHWNEFKKCICAYADAMKQAQELRRVGR